MRSAIYHFIFYARKFWMHYITLWELKNQHSLLIFINRRMVGEASLQWATTVWHKSHATLKATPPRPSSPKRKKFRVQKVYLLRTQFDSWTELDSSAELHSRTDFDFWLNHTLGLNPNFDFTLA